MKHTIVLSCIVLIFSFCDKKPEKKPISPHAKLELRLAVDSLTADFEENELEGRKIYLNPKVEISEKDIAFVSIEEDSYGYPNLFLDLKPEATKKFATLTANNLQKKLAILVGGKLIMAPVIQTEIPGGKIQISGNFTKIEIDKMFTNLTN